MKTRTIKLVLVFLFTLSMGTTAYCNYFPQGEKNYPDNNSKEIFYTVLNVGRIIGNMVFTSEIPETVYLKPDCNNNIRVGFFSLDLTCNNVCSFYDNFRVFRQPFSDLFIKKIYGSGMQFGKKGLYTRDSIA